MSCARYHCDSQRRQGREGACAAASCQRRCTSRDIILRSPAACTANHELSGSSSAPTRASRRVGRRNQPARRDTLAARMSKAQHCIQRHAESRQGRVRASAGANPRMPPGSITSAAQSFIRSASSEDSPCFALFDLCLRQRRNRLMWVKARGVTEKPLPLTSAQSCPQGLGGPRLVAREKGRPFMLLEGYWRPKLTSPAGMASHRPYRPSLSDRTGWRVRARVRARAARMALIPRPQSAHR